MDVCSLCKLLTVAATASCKENKITYMVQSVAWPAGLNYSSVLYVLLNTQTYNWLANLSPLIGLSAYC